MLMYKRKTQLYFTSQIVYMRTFKFYKTEVGRWYVDLPEWEGSVDELEMVAGADLFLEILSDGEQTVNVILSTVEFEGADILEFKELGRIESWELGEGAWYEMIGYMGIDYELTMWLCDVTKFVFDEFPKNIYFQKVS
jgi:hypothetical protein